ncbi:MAG: hypothetical protein WCX61_05365 [Candidatus Peribacteraceae bacterium]|jgi:hypothetical protein
MKREFNDNDLTGKGSVILDEEVVLKSSLNEREHILAPGTRITTKPLMPNLIDVSFHTKEGVIKIMIYPGQLLGKRIIDDRSEKTVS